MGFRSQRRGSPASLRSELTSREGVGAGAADGAAIGFTCGCVRVWCIPCLKRSPSITMRCAVRYNYNLVGVRVWVGSGIATSSLLLSLSSSLSLVRIGAVRL